MHEPFIHGIFYFWLFVGGEGNALRQTYLLERKDCFLILKVTLLNSKSNAYRGSLNFPVFHIYRNVPFDFFG